MVALCPLYVYGNRGYLQGIISPDLCLGLSLYVMASIKGNDDGNEYDEH